jgi:hypothetical protein
MAAVILALFSIMSTLMARQFVAFSKQQAFFMSTKALNAKDKKRVVEHRAICHHIVIDSRVVDGGICRAVRRIA